MANRPNIFQMLLVFLLTVILLREGSVVAVCARATLTEKATECIFMLHAAWSAVLGSSVVHLQLFFALVFPSSLSSLPSLLSYPLPPASLNPAVVAPKMIFFCGGGWQLRTGRRY